MADEDEIDNTLPDPQPNPEPIPPQPPAEIKAAQYDYDGKTVVLIIRPLGSPVDAIFVLNETDQNGLSPWIREELAKLVDAGDIVIEPAPEIASQRSAADADGADLTPAHPFELTVRAAQEAL